MRESAQASPTGVAATPAVRAASISIEIIRADGSRIPVGEVAAYHRNPLVRAWRNLVARRNLRRLYHDHPQYRPTQPPQDTPT